MEEMTCSRCKETKPIDSFIKSKKAKFGRKNPCKECINLYKKTGLGFTVPISEVKAQYEKQKAKRTFLSEKRMIEMVCLKCRKLKPVSEFRKLSRLKSSRTQPCKSCASTQGKIYKQKPAAKKKANENQKNRARKLRLEVLQAYGNFCACCGESESKCLAIDHIYNDGAQHRREGKISTHLYRFLQKNGFPKDRYQLLCHSCNMAKGLYGECPHNLNPISQFLRSVTDEKL